MENPRGLSEMMLRAWKDRDWDALRGKLHRDYVYIDPTGERVAGVEEGLKAAWSSFADAFPDGDYEITGVYADGETVVSEFRVTGTHQGELLGVAPSGNRVEFDICNVMQLRDGQVITERDYVDTKGLLAQLSARIEDSGQ